jgi:hypothetical protein
MSYSSDHTVWTPACAVCKAPVELETCNTDERGRAVHEECYVRKIRSTQTAPQFRPRVVQLRRVKFDSCSSSRQFQNTRVILR